MYKIATINTWKCDGLYFQRLQALKNQLKLIEPDILLFQEAFQSEDNRFNTSAYIAGEMEYNFVSSISRPKKRKIDGEMADSFSNVSILSRFPIIDKYIFSLPSTPNDGGREAIFAKIRLKEKILIACSLHLSHLRDGAELRTSQLLSILNHTYLRTTCDYIIVGGDFNFVLSSGYIDKLPYDHFFIEDTFIYSKDKTKPDYTLLKGIPCKIDHILQVWPKLSTKLSVQDSCIIFEKEDPEAGTKISDHNGVMINFDLGIEQN